METLRLKPRQPVEDSVENWDDDDFDMDGDDDITFRSQSTSANGPSRRRDSHSSLRSDFESVHGEEEKQVHLPDDDEKSTLDAIAAATKAGIPIPTNVPHSALMGGTIKRLGGRKLKQVIQDDWADDLDFPDTAQPLKVKPQDGSRFPDALRQVSGGSPQHSPSKPSQYSQPPALVTPARQSALPSAINLDRFRDTDDDEDLFGDGGETIKVSKSQSLLKPAVPLVTPPTPSKPATDDDFETDFELPSDGKLKLSTRKDIPKTPALSALEDFDWGEGSLGTRFGGTRRDGRSNRSSSVSALSPSIASSFTIESEDEALDGLVLPSGPVNFGERLSQQRKTRSPERTNAEQPPRQAKPPSPPAEADKDDMLHGLDIGDGEVFDSRKLTLHRNIQLKETRPASPSRPKTAVALKFTNKPVASSRLPRPLGSGPGHERSHTQSSLEPVSESGGPVTHTRRSLSRLGHSAQSSVSSIPTPTTPSSGPSTPASTPRGREMGQKPSVTNLRDGPTTTSAQLLRLKRSLPVMRPPQSPARPLTSRPSYERPLSRTDTSRPQSSSLRPKTPVDRPRPVESPAAFARKPPVPFLPAGASASQSRNVNAAKSRNFRRQDSDYTLDFRPNSRAFSRSAIRSPSPRKQRGADKVTQDGAAWHQLNKPRRVRHFGDGHELDGFDDLPTSTQTEARYMRQPVNGGPKVQLRNKLYQNILPDRTNSPSPQSPYYHPSRVPDNLPSFARDTAASRIARETNLAQRVPSGPLAPLTSQRVAQLSARGNLNPHLPQSSVRSKKLRKVPQLKPHLISNLNSPRESKSKLMSQKPFLLPTYFSCLITPLSNSYVVKRSMACSTIPSHTNGRATITH